MPPLTKAELLKRRESIGGSDIAAIAGVSRHTSPFRLYLKKIGEDPDEGLPDTEAQIFGHLFEDPIARYYEMRHGCRLDSMAETLVHPDYPFLTANPDRLWMDERRLIEIKTTGLGGVEYWRDPDHRGDMRVPAHVVLQDNWYLGFLHWKDADTLLLSFAQSYDSPERYYEFPLEFDHELFEMQVQLSVDFWRNHVLKRVPPDATDQEELADYLGKRYITHSDRLIEATDEATAIARRLAYATEQLKHWEEQKATEANGLKALIGDSQGIKGPDWVYTWKQTKGSGTDWKALAMHLGATDEDMQRFTKPGYRRPYFKFKGDDQHETRAVTPRRALIVKDD